MAKIEKTTYTICSYCPPCGYNEVTESPADETPICVDFTTEAAEPLQDVPTLSQRG